MKTTVEKQIKMLTIWLSVLTLLILLMLFFMWRDNTNHKKEIKGIQFEILTLKNTQSQFKNDLSLIKLALKTSKSKIDSLGAVVSKLEKRVDENEWNIVVLESNVNAIRNQIYVLIAKIDSLENASNVRVEAVEIPVVNNTASDTITSKNLSIQIEKTIWNKKSKITKTTLLDYSAPVTFVNGLGFEKDSLSYLYQYMNERKDSVKLNLNNFINRENLSLGIVKTSKNENLVLLNENKEFQAGAGGLLLKNEIPVEVKWEYQFYEKTLNPERRKKGNTEIIVGSSLIATGLFSYWYFDNHPIAIINVTRHGQPVFHDEIENDVAKGIAVGVSVVGAGFIVKGCIDKRLSYTLSPTELSVNYLLK